jgi:hypothetical protein
MSELEKLLAGYIKHYKPGVEKYVVFLLFNNRYFAFGRDTCEVLRKLARARVIYMTRSDLCTVSYCVLNKEDYDYAIDQLSEKGYVIKLVIK